MSDTIYSNGMLFVKKIFLENVENYISDEGNVGGKFMFSVCLDKEGNVIIKDTLYNIKKTGKYNR